MSLPEWGCEQQDFAVIHGPFNLKGCFQLLRNQIAMNRFLNYSHCKARFIVFAFSLNHLLATLCLLVCLNLPASAQSGVESPRASYHPVLQFKLSSAVSDCLVFTVCIIFEPVLIEAC